MQQLNEAITTVLLEVERSFANRRTEGGLPMIPTRIRLTLNFALDAAGRSAHAQPDSPHSVTVEFKAGESGQLQPVVATKTQVDAPEAPATASEAPVVNRTAEGGIIPLLAQVFGPPGFDSSARATVFRETLGGRSDDEMQMVLAALRSEPNAPLDDATCQASHVLRGIIQSGPMKNVGQGAKVLAELLTQHPLAEVLRATETTWKTHDDWLGPTRSRPAHS